MATSVLIVGAGIAGSTLAWELHHRGFDISMLDSNKKNTASRIAGGIVNPITGKRLTKKDNYDALIDSAIKLYNNIEQITGTCCISRRTLTRIFKSTKEIEVTEKRLKDHLYKNHLKVSSLNASIIDAPLGSIDIDPVYVLDTCSFLDGVKGYLSSRINWIETQLEYHDIASEKGLIHYKKHSYNHIIFCEGYRCANNPWFSDLPWAPAKGEMLTLKSQELQLKNILNKGRWILPLEDSTFKIGATYSWDPINTEPTAKGQEELLASFSEMLPKVSAEIINHQAGVRPCTKDALPFIGSHPEHPNIHCFNGFGSKGTLMAPFYANILAKNNLKLPESEKACNLARFLAK